MLHVQADETGADSGAVVWLASENDERSLLMSSVTGPLLL